MSSAGVTWSLPPMLTWKQSRVRKSAESFFRRSWLCVGRMMIGMCGCYSRVSRSGSCDLWYLMKKLPQGMTSNWCLPLLAHVDPGNGKLTLLSKIILYFRGVCPSELKLLSKIILYFRGVCPSVRPSKLCQQVSLYISVWFQWRTRPPISSVQIQSSNESVSWHYMYHDYWIRTVM